MERTKPYRVISNRVHTSVNKGRGTFIGRSKEICANNESNEVSATILVGQGIKQYPKRGDLVRLRNKRWVIFEHYMVDSDIDDVFYKYNSLENWIWCRTERGAGLIDMADIERIVDGENFETDQDRFDYIRTMNKLDK